MSAEIVTVIVTSYNSSQFIIETLESVFRQTWDNIELIVTDDCSSDDTVAVCRAWMEAKSGRFRRIKLLTSEINTGVAANANRGLMEAKGAWIKFIAADDTLMPDCVEKNMKYLESHAETKILFSKVVIYKDSFLPENMIGTTEDDRHDPRSIMNESRSAGSQYRMLLVSDRIHYTPSAFIHRNTLLSVGGYDEKMKLMEDYPLWLKLTGEGYRLDFMNITTVNYRRHSKALNNKGQNLIVNPNYFKSEAFRREYTYPFLPAVIRYEQRLNWLISSIFRCSFLNRDNKPNRILYNLLTACINPFKYYKYFYRKLRKDLIYNEFYY